MSLSCFSQNYLDYYDLVNKAKLETLDSNLSKSVILYKSAFEQFDFQFARDCIHACEVSVRNKSDSLTYYFMEYALLRGVPLTYFHENDLYKDFQSTKYWTTIVGKSEFYKTQYQAHINHSIRKEINGMFKADQEIRRKYYHWSRWLFRPFLGRRWRALNAQQVNRLMEITTKYGFPGEKLIGIDLPNYHEKIDENQLSAGMPIVILLHHYSHPNVSHDSLLLNEVLSGNLYNEHFASICDFEAHFGKGRHACLGYYGLRQKPKDMNLSSMRDKRTEIGLLTEKEFKALNRGTILTKFWNYLK